MNRLHRITLLVLVFSALAPVAFAQSKMTEHKKIITSKILSIQPKQALKAPRARFAGLPCAQVFPVYLTVDKKITANPHHLVVAQGDCIYWKSQATNGHATAIRGIKFIDTANDAATTGKTQNMYAVGMACAGSGASCMIMVSLPDGLYRYQAIVNHDGADKKSDPEVEVSCGSNCGDPGDYVPPPPPHP